MISAATSAAPATGRSSAGSGTRGASTAITRPAAAELLATRGLPGEAACTDGRRPSRTTPAPTTGPAAARAVARVPSAKHRTSGPAASAATPARLSAAPAPASRQVAVREKNADLSVAVRHASATSASGTRNAAVALAYVNVEAARHKPCDGRPHGR